MTTADLMALAEQACPATAAGIRRAMAVQTPRSADVPQRPRRAAGTMNKTEALFAARLEAMKRAGAVRGWAYEAWTMVVVSAGGKRVRYTPDFLAWSDGGRVTFVEVKGFLREDAKLKFMAAAQAYPFCRFTMVRRGRAKGEPDWVVMMDLNPGEGPPCRP